MPVTDIVRTTLMGQACIQKTMRNSKEAWILQKLENVGFPAPRILEVVQQKSSDGDLLLMEEIPGPHLETVPNRFFQAIDLCLKIQKLDFQTGVASITSESLLYDLQTGFVMEEIGEIFRWNEDKMTPLIQMYQETVSKGPLYEPLQFSHGDFHPRNLIVSHGQVIAIDWEKAGFHSIFQDIYALLHMCYPEREASLTSSFQKQLFLNYMQKCDSKWWEHYCSFVMINRFCELMHISRDVRNHSRNLLGLLLQADTVYDELTQINKLKVAPL